MLWEVKVKTISMTAGKGYKNQPCFEIDNLNNFYDVNIREWWLKDVKIRLQKLFAQF